MLDKNWVAGASYSYTWYQTSYGCIGKQASTYSSVSQPYEAHKEFYW